MRYIFTFIAHKWYVFIIGIHIGVPLWRLLTHDMNKLLPWNYIAYNRQVYGTRKHAYQWESCALRHQNSNDHHWEFWVMRNSGHDHDSTLEVLRMPEGAMQEMVADWLAKDRQHYGFWPDPATWRWWAFNKKVILLHTDTRGSVEQLVGELATAYPRTWYKSI